MGTALRSSWRPDHSHFSRGPLPRRFGSRCTLLVVARAKGERWTRFGRWGREEATARGGRGPRQGGPKGGPPRARPEARPSVRAEPLSAAAVGVACSPDFPPPADVSPGLSPPHHSGPPRVRPARLARGPSQPRLPRARPAGGGGPRPSRAPAAAKRGRFCDAVTAKWCDGRSCCRGRCAPHRELRGGSRRRSERAAEGTESGGRRRAGGEGSRAARALAPRRSP